MIVLFILMKTLLTEIRLNLMNNFVDYFIIVEANIHIWQNNSKKL